MSQEFSLLQHLGVTVPESVARNVLATTPVRNTFRVMSPCRRPPGAVGAVSAKMHARGRSAPEAPLADFAGEVMTVQAGKGGNDTEYLIYNARVPSVEAVNMKLAEERKKEHRDKRNEELRIDDAMFGNRTSDEVKRRQLLQILQQANMEQARRKREEKERDRCKRIEHERSELRRLAENESAAETARAAERRKKQLEELRQLAEQSRENKRLRPTSSRNSQDGKECFAFPWEAPASENKGARARCIAIREENRRLAEQRRNQHECLGSARSPAAEKFIATDAGAVDGGGDTSPQAAHVADNMGVKEHARCATPRHEDSGDGWFFRTHAASPRCAREKMSKLMEENKRMAEEAKNRQIQEKLQRIKSEQEFLRRASEAYKEEVMRQQREKKKRYELRSQEKPGEGSVRSRARRSASVDAVQDGFFLMFDNRKAETGRRERQKRYYNALREEIASAREARIAERKNAIEQDRIFCREAAAAEKELAEKELLKRKQKENNYRTALEEQIRSKRKAVTSETPLRTRGPNIGVLYRCPVTSKLLPPGEFGVPFRRRGQNSLLY
ncbi:hypothetical protein ERJ75_000783600 [Trypanosoma vivax]|nr:hypothetical protein ERJ75_000783600 [Trypanosoma vivax]